MEATNSDRTPTLLINHHIDKSNNYIHDLKGSMEALTGSFDGLNAQAMQIALLREVGTKQEIASLRQQMCNQDQKHKEGMHEIQRILDNFLQNQVVENMRKQVEREIAGQIDDLVKAQVSSCLHDHMPHDLQLEVTERKRELEELNLRLHNSESRRTNGNLRSNKPDEVLAPILMTDGTVSPRFPKDLKSLFSLDADTVKALMVDYEFKTPPTPNSDHNLNRFMQFCGVRYQLVVRCPATPAAMSEKET